MRLSRISSLRSPFSDHIIDMIGEMFPGKFNLITSSEFNFVAISR